MRQTLRMTISAVATAGALALAGCSQIAAACQDVDNTLGSVDSALAQAVTAAEAGDLSGVSAALDTANSSVTKAGEDAAGSPAAGVVAGLADGLTGITGGITSGIDAASGTVQATDAKIAEIKTRLTSAKELVAGKRDAIAKVCAA